MKSDATAVKIRKTYRDLSQKYHPDKFDRKLISEKEAKDKFQQIARAYEVRRRASLTAPPPPCRAAADAPTAPLTPRRAVAGRARADPQRHGQAQEVR